MFVGLFWWDLAQHLIGICWILSNFSWVGDRFFALIGKEELLVRLGDRKLWLRLNCVGSSKEKSWGSDSETTIVAFHWKAICGIELGKARALQVVILWNWVGLLIVVLFVQFPVFCFSRFGLGREKVRTIVVGHCGIMAETCWDLLRILDNFLLGLTQEP